MNKKYTQDFNYKPTIKEFKPYIFTINKMEKQMLLICVSHLNYNNFKDKKDMYNDYKNYHKQYLPDVKINTLKSKLNNVSDFGGQIMLIEPEIDWLLRGLRELTEYSLEDMKESTNNRYNPDYTEVQLTILTKMSIAINKEPPQKLCNEYNSLKKKIN